MDFSNWFSSGRLDDDDEFLKEFKAATGKTPTEYINHHRIEGAKKVLADPRCKDIPVADIADEVGYSDPEEFKTLFYLKEGVYPEKYRQQQLSE